MIRTLWRTLTAPIREFREGVRDLRTEQADSKRATTVERRKNRLLARDVGLDPETINEAVFGRPRPSQQRKGHA
jgi:hypothetical protein